MPVTRTQQGASQFSPSFITFKGVRKMSKRVINMAKQSSGAALDALEYEGQNIVLEAQNLCPVRTGRLKKSIQMVTKSKGFGTTGRGRSRRDLAVAIRFGGPGIPYALEQHENLFYHHTNGEARFVVKAMNRNLPGLNRRVAENIKFGIRIMV